MIFRLQSLNRGPCPSPQQIEYQMFDYMTVSKWNVVAITNLIPRRNVGQSVTGFVWSIAVTLINLLHSSL